MGQVPHIERAVVLGAGVMGAQIAALLANAGIRVDLLDMPGQEDGAGLARSGLERVLKIRPPAFFLPEMAQGIEPGSLEDLSCVAAADWVIEAIVEDMEAKKALLARVEEVAGEDLVISSNTSGLSIEAMVRERSLRFRKNFLGIHFFNPPRYMKLVELIPGPDTEPVAVVKMRIFLEEVLGKGGVEARDTPNFIANRLGVFALMDILHGMAAGGFSVASVDALTGPLLGRPRSATLRLCDLIGLDTLAHVARTAYEHLPEDSQRAVFAQPGFVQDMLQQGLQGAKSGGGFYRKGEAGIQALDLETLEYGEMAIQDLGALAKASRHPDLQVRLQAVMDDQSRAGVFAWNHLRQVLVYAAQNAAEMATDIAQIDRAMKWGFNWEAGPFELWDLLGVKQVVQRCEQDGARVPDLVRDVVESGEDRFYREEEEGLLIFPLAKSGAVEVRPRPAENLEACLRPGNALYKSDNAYLAELGEGVGALVFQGKMNVIGPGGLELVQRLVDESPFAALLLWGAGGLFSAGADLEYMMGLAEDEDWDGLEGFVRYFQDAILALRYAAFPVVAAPRGLTLGGGCEFCLAVDARVVAAELRIGLVETRVGLIPGGGGCKEMVRRQGRDIEKGFRTILAGGFSDNAYQGRQWQLLGQEDDIVLGEDRVLLRAFEQAKSLVQTGYEPPARAAGLEVAGAQGRQTLEAWLEGQVQGGFLTPHDQTVGRGLARVLCGGDGPMRAVSEQDLLDLEREVFMHLCGLERTRARMAHMLKTGKPLRN